MNIQPEHASRQVGIEMFPSDLGANMLIKTSVKKSLLSHIESALSIANDELTRFKINEGYGRGAHRFTKPPEARQQAPALAAVIDMLDVAKKTLIASNSVKDSGGGAKKQGGYRKRRSTKKKRKKTRRRRR